MRGVYVRTAETRAILSAAQMGHVVSPEARAKMSATRMGHAPSGPPHHTLETRAKIGATLWRGGKGVTRAKNKAKRRSLGFIPLNKWFEDCEGHHVDDEQVIHIPRALHKSVSHDHNTGRGMAKINAIAYNYLFKQEVEAAMAAKE